MFAPVLNPDPQALAALDGLHKRLARLADKAGHRLSLRQAIVLVEIMRADRAGKEFSFSDISIPIEWRSVTAMRASGLIDTEDDPGDRRRTLLSLSEEGRAWAIEFTVGLG